MSYRTPYYCCQNYDVAHPLRSKSTAESKTVVKSQQQRMKYKIAGFYTILKDPGDNEGENGSDASDDDDGDGGNDEIDEDEGVDMMGDDP
ncbi:hypothetical protein MTR_5g037510 [Medicago truncatula]|uniref:Uncharacterized protein n=1 Tax=Medicago truncatula TaxID=3880 RepID=G7K8B8_MEDTR|nr:hypothetical protein MTR_5g037510 [Medicago truncatula]